MHKKYFFETIMPFFLKTKYFYVGGGRGGEVPIFSNTAPSLVFSALPFFQSRMNSATYNFKTDLRKELELLLYIYINSWGTNIKCVPRVIVISD